MQWKTTKGQKSPNISQYSSAAKDSNRSEDMEGQESEEDEVKEAD